MAEVRLILPTRDPDWFRVHESISDAVRHRPGVSHDAGAPRGYMTKAHRTHLPLLEAGAAQAQRWQITSSGALWAARDIATAPRGFKLRTTQQQAIDFLASRPGALLGDDMRLGKTLSALMTHVANTGPLVVIAPLSTRGVWLRWMAKVFPDVPIAVCKGKTYDAKLLKQSPLVFAHYDILASWDAIWKIGTIVFDEAHVLTNRNARRTLAASTMRVQAARAIAMTGTPIWKLPQDLWAVLNLVIPGAWGNYYEFGNRYAAPESTAHGVRYTGASNEAELNCRLTDVMLRRRWVDVAEDLPPISRSVIVAEVDQAARNKLDIMAAKLRGERTNTAGYMASFCKASSMLKLPVAAAEADKLVSRGEPVIMWTWHKEPAQKLHEKLDGLHGRPKSFLIHGEISAHERDERIAAWKAWPGPAVLIATMAVGQVGIDLSHARFAIFVELYWVPAIIGQAEMRGFVMGRPMDIVFVVADHIFDQRMVRTLITKLGAASEFGVGAATESIDVLRDALLGPEEIGDLDRLMEQLIASNS